MDELTGVAYGVLGGFLAELLGLFKLRREVNLPEYLTSKFYWIVTILMILSGGLIIYVYLESGAVAGMSPILAINIGASAPFVLGGIISQTPLPSEPRID